MSTHQIVWIAICPKRIEDLIMFMMGGEGFESRVLPSKVGYKAGMETRFGDLKYFLNLYPGELVRGWRAGVCGLGL